MAGQLQQKKEELEVHYKKLLDHQMNSMTGDAPPSKTEKQDLVRLYVECTRTDTAINHLTTRARTWNTLNTCMWYMQANLYKSWLVWKLPMAKVLWAREDNQSAQGEGFWEVEQEQENGERKGKEVEER